MIARRQRSRAIVHCLVPPAEILSVTDLRRYDTLYSSRPSWSSSASFFPAKNAFLRRARSL